MLMESHLRIDFILLLCALDSLVGLFSPLVELYLLHLAVILVLSALDNLVGLVSHVGLFFFLMFVLYLLRRYQLFKTGFSLQNMILLLA